MNNEKLKYIKNNYDKESTKTMMKKLDLSESTIRRCLRKLGIKRKPQIVEYIPWAEEYFFDFPLNKKSAYILGYILADGCLLKPKTKRSKSFEITSKDKDIIYKMHSAIEYGNITRDKKTNTYKLRISSIKMYDQLKKLGVKERKAGKIWGISDYINDKIFPAFLLGYFDGDGSITFDRNTLANGSEIKYPVFQVLGNLQFIENISDRLLKYTGLKGVIYQDEHKGKRNIHHDLFQYQLYGYNKCKWIYRYMYENSDLYMDRKKATFERLFEPFEQHLPLFPEG